MMKKLFKKYQIVIISAITVLVIGILILMLINLFTKNSSLKEVNREEYAFKYDKSWKVKEKKDDQIILKHKSGSKITIQITKLADEYRYSTIEELIDEIIYSIQKQNTDYKLISRKEDKLTKYEYNGYKLLYENNKDQVMINTYKRSDQLITIRYEANNKYFDILLDSVHNIIYNLNIKDKKFDLKNSIKVDTGNVQYRKSDNLDKKLKDTKSYELAKNNYLVDYEIPSNFDRQILDTTLGIFNYKVSEYEEISIVTDIYKVNIYQYLDKADLPNVYNNYSYLHDKKDKDYSDFKEVIEKDNDRYIYKNSYLYKTIRYDKKAQTKEYKRKDETVELIYPLDNNHTFVIKIDAKEVPITKKLIDKIKVNKATNYASYIRVKKDGDFLVGELEKFADYSKTKTKVVTIKVPDKYQEIDKGNNRYVNKNYSYNYNDKLMVYDYTVHYELTSLKEESIIDTINSVYIKTAYGKYQKLTNSGNLTVNDKKLKVYDGGYTDLSGIMFTNTNRVNYYVSKKVLFYNIDSENNLYIEIDGNGKTITNEIINELVNFTVKDKKY